MSKQTNAPTWSAHGHAPTTLTPPCTLTKADCCIYQLAKRLVYAHYTLPITTHTPTYFTHKHSYTHPYTHTDRVQHLITNRFFWATETAGSSFGANFLCVILELTNYRYGTIEVSNVYFIEGRVVKGQLQTDITSSNLDMIYK